MSKIFVDQVDPRTATTLTLGTTGDTVSIPSGVTIANAGTATGFGDATNFRPNVDPLIINGDMAVAQRSTSVAGVTGNGYQTCDRLKLQVSDAGTWTVIQEALSSGAAYTDGFSTAFRIDCTAADASVAAASYLYPKYMIEGQDLQLLKKGTANAEPVTISFWVKSNLTGNYQLTIRDQNTRMCAGVYAISIADTWEKKTINIAADTSGVIANTNGEGLALEFWLAAGSNYTGGTAPTAWEAKVDTDRAAGLNVQMSSSTSNDWAITGIQLEVGTYTSATLPPFQHESYGDSLSRCQRYFVQFGNNQGVADQGNYGLGITNNDNEGCHVLIPLPTTMRTASSTITQSGTASDYAVRTTTTDASTGVPVFADATTSNILVKFVNNGHGFGTGVVVRGMTNADPSFIGVSAEL